MMRGLHIVLAVILAALPAVALADIVKWTDDAGVTHYTNLKGEVPSQHAVQVVVDEQVWVPPGPAVPDADEFPVAPAQPPPATEDEVSRAYVAGVASGLAGTVSTGGSVYINGPLAVTVPAPPAYAVYGQPGYDWLGPGYYPFFTTAVLGQPRGPMRGRFSPGFQGRVRVFPRSVSAAGPPPIGAAGRPPGGAVGGLRNVSGGHFRR